LVFSDHHCSEAFKADSSFGATKEYCLARSAISASDASGNGRVLKFEVIDTETVIPALPWLALDSCLGDERIPLVEAERAWAPGFGAGDEPKILEIKLNKPKILLR
jgi:hypothetical protein